jgi:hypothetical protein
MHRSQEYPYSIIVQKSFDEIEGYDEMIALCGIRFESHTSITWHPLLGSMAWVAVQGGSCRDGGHSWHRQTSLGIRRAQTAKKVAGWVLAVAASCLLPQPARPRLGLLERRRRRLGESLWSAVGIADWPGFYWVALCPPVSSDVLMSAGAGVRCPSLLQVCQPSTGGALNAPPNVVLSSVL